MTTVPAVVPLLETKRLRLRQLLAADFEGYAEHMADPVATKHMSGIVDRRMAWRTFAALSGTWLLNGSGWWAIETKAKAEMVGIVGAFYRESPLEGGRAGDIELGWSIYQPHWRNGYASEAAAEALRFGFEHHRAPRAIAHIDGPNVASLGVSRAIGMAYVADVDFYGHKSTLHAIERPST
jgi:RimJ/RimL family protein N-acetyltransferase